MSLRDTHRVRYATRCGTVQANEKRPSDGHFGHRFGDGRPGSLLLLEPPDGIRNRLARRAWMKAQFTAGLGMAEVRVAANGIQGIARKKTVAHRPVCYIMASGRQSNRPARAGLRGWHASDPSHPRPFGPLPGPSAGRHSRYRSPRAGLSRLPG
jgi:hypothetical protein